MAKARAKLDKMWRIWYAILVLILHIFLLYSAFQRYGSFRGKALREQWDMSPMNFYLAMMIVAGFLLPFFMYAAFVQTGNYAEDGVQIGRDRENLRVAVAETAAGGGVASGAACAARLRRHFMPYTCVLHVLMSFCLLIPMPVLEAAEIHYAKRSKEEIWRTNLDFLYRPTASATSSVSPEVFNLMLALAILLVRYPSAFWFSNRVFAFLFSAILCICGVHIVLAYEATSVLFKASVTEGAAQVNLVPAAIIILHSIGDLLLLLANIAFFEFGYTQMLSNLRKYRHYLQLEASSSASDRSTSSCSDDTPCWLSYAPHLVGILLMVLAVLCKAPVLWDWVGIYRVHRQQSMLAAIVSGGFYLIMWVAVWFLFGFKATWKFNIRLELEFPSKLGGNFQQQQHQQQHQQLQRSDSDLGSKRGNNYMYLQSRGNGEALSMIPTISEQVDIASESSYTCGAGGNGGSSTLERQQRGSSSGLVKYQVRRGSTQSSASQFSGNGSLRRTASNCGSRGNNPGCIGGNRVTFKDLHEEAIPGSPNTSSSDSGIDSSRIAVQMGITPDDPYARVNKLQSLVQQPQQPKQQSQQQPYRAPSRQSNYEDYQMFGSLFNPQQQQQQQQHQQMVPEREYYTRQELELAASQNDIYGRLGGSVASVTLGGAARPSGLARIPSEDFETYATSGDYRQPPDILLSKSPYGSLNRPSHNAAASGHHQLMMQQLQQQQHQHHRGSYSSLPRPPVPTELADADDHVDGLCSQV